MGGRRSGGQHRHHILARRSAWDGAYPFASHQCVVTGTSKPSWTLQAPVLANLDGMLCAERVQWFSELGEPASHSDLLLSSWWRHGGRRRLHTATAGLALQRGRGGHPELPGWLPCASGAPGSEERWAKGVAGSSWVGDRHPQAVLRAVGFLDRTSRPVEANGSRCDRRPRPYGTSDVQSRSCVRGCREQPPAPAPLYRTARQWEAGSSAPAQR